MFRKSLRRAWQDTFRVLGGWGLFVAIFLITPVGFFLHWLTSGYVAVTQEIAIWVIYGLVASGAVFIGLFLLQIIAAPYRIERDAHYETKRNRDELSTDVAKLKAEVPNLNCNINGMVIDGDKGFVFVFATIKNIGRASSKVLSLRLALRCGTSDRLLEVTHPRSITYQEHGSKITYRHPDALFAKGGSDSITPGDVIRGYVVGKITNDEALLEGNATLQLIVFDAYENETTVEKPFTSISCGFLPGTAPEVEKIE